MNKTDARKPIHQVLVFRAGGRGLALPLEWVEEVLHLPSLLKPPGLPALVEGFLNLGGRAVPVLRPDRLFELQEQRLHLYTPLVVLRNGELALLADAVEGVLEMAEERLLPAPEGRAFNDCARAALEMGGEIFHLLDPGRLLLEEERRRLEALREAAHQRLAAWEEGQG